MSHQQNVSPEVEVNTSEFLFEFTCSDNHKIIECGVQILKDGPKAVGKICYQNVENVDGTKLTYCWSCFRTLGLRKEEKRSIRSFVVP